MKELYDIFSDLFQRRGVGIVAAVIFGMVLFVVIKWKIDSIMSWITWGVDQVKRLIFLWQLVPELQGKVKELEADLVVAQSENKKLTKKWDDLWKKYDGQKDVVVQLDQESKTLSQTIDGTLNLGGRLWNSPLAETAPPFISLQDRVTPIISVVNLKGGVGKSTVSGNLGAAYAQSGHVLLVDLDYQSSLTLLCVNQDNNLIENLNLKEKTGPHFFRDSDHSFASLLKRVTPAKDIDGDVVITHDRLADVETHLLFRSLLDQTFTEDVRLILRTALHTPGLNEKYQHIILDCPPRPTTACINALACSDYILIPVIPDYTSLLPVARLLDLLGSLHGIFPNISKVGVVANMTYNWNKFSDQQEKDWVRIQDECKVIAKRGNIDVTFFKTTIKRASEFAKAASENRLAAIDPDYDDICTAFKSLAKDVTKMLKKKVSAGAAEESGEPADVAG